MTDGAVWIMVGVVLCGAELLHPGVFLLWIGLGAMAGGAATLALHLDFPWQVGAFLICLVASLSIPVLRRRQRGAADGGINAPSIGLIGKPCRALAFDGTDGRVSLGDGTWLARIIAGATPEAGASLRVVGLDGTTLLVTPIETLPLETSGDRHGDDPS
ncbi:NfeD family protein [Lichenihabitans sp. PAMC28606]|uniref:NfeD family protein n=1 Tax=Lichenihabitans sp. PAMC28606 TaxID=2880932 RepID=UPI001D0A557E|nr:NfeD family protein [Lichenihabitans sp. PAMC28606]UDL96223.1 NfeD family protein [Lichenihabitans sp. PAMC28606]